MYSKEEQLHLLKTWMENNHSESSMINKVNIDIDHNKVLELSDISNKIKEIKDKKKKKKKNKKYILIRDSPSLRKKGGKNYGDSYNFPGNYPSVSDMQSFMTPSVSDLGPIPF